MYNNISDFKIRIDRSKYIFPNQTLSTIKNVVFQLLIDQNVEKHKIVRLFIALSGVLLFLFFLFLVLQFIG